MILVFSKLFLIKSVMSDYRVVSSGLTLSNVRTAFCNYILELRRYFTRVRRNEFLHKLDKLWQTVEARRFSFGRANKMQLRSCGEGIFFILRARLIYVQQNNVVGSHKFAAWVWQLEAGNHFIISMNQFYLSSESSFLITNLFRLSSQLKNGTAQDSKTRFLVFL